MKKEYCKKCGEFKGLEEIPMYEDNTWLILLLLFLMTNSNEYETEKENGIVINIILGGDE